jgi:hypothetical protein
MDLHFCAVLVTSSPLRVKLRQVHLKYFKLISSFYSAVQYSDNMVDGPPRFTNQQCEEKS